MSMSKAKVVLGTLLIFALGVFAGAFGTNMYFKGRMEQLFSKGEPPPVVHLFMKRLSNKLDLTDTQRREIEGIVRQSYLEFQEVRRKFRPEIDTIMNNTFAEIEQKLDEEQQRQFKEFREQFRFSHGRKGAFGKQSSKPFDRIARRFLAEVDRNLVLTEDQRLQVDEIIEKHLSEMRDILKSSRGGRQGETDESQAKLYDLNRQTEDRLRVILSEEQLMTYQKIWNEQRQELWDKMSRNRQRSVMEE